MSGKTSAQAIEVGQVDLGWLGELSGTSPLLPVSTDLVGPDLSGKAVAQAIEMSPRIHPLHLSADTVFMRSPSPNATVFLWSRQLLLIRTRAIALWQARATMGW